MAIVINAHALINVPCLFSDNHVNLYEVCLLHWMMYLFDMGSACKEKNLLLEEQILSFQVDPN